MSPALLKDRTLRMKKILNILQVLFPVRKTMLVYRNPFELLISVILSAQCTDAQVNKVTPTLFRAYPTPQKLAAAPLSDIARIIYTTGFFKIKSERIKGCAQVLITEFNGIVHKLHTN